MSNRIHQLSPEVANQIAAGEVIERPANVIKELVENALDAGARRITIEIEEGGKKLIRVRDDGYGMSPEDAVLSLQAHATSKITDANDLWSMQTLGFRGEALPSLAAVSRLEMTTREEGVESGTQLIVEAGTVLDVREVGCAPGTEIVVRSLFFNTPARFKFLKSDSVEAARISELVGHLALAYPTVSFLLKHNGKEQLRVDGNGDAFNSVVAILGRDTSRQLMPIPVSYDEPGDIKVSGFVGRPQLTRANRNGQLFFVNGRLIRSQNLQHAFKAAYEGLIHGHDRHAVGVIFLQVAPGAVDLDVHPTKSEVRFVKDAEAHHPLRVAVRNTLVGAQLAPSWSLGNDSQSSGTASSTPSGKVSGGLTASTFTKFTRPRRPQPSECENLKI